MEHSIFLSPFFSYKKEENNSIVSLYNELYKKRIEVSSDRFNHLFSSLLNSDEYVRNSQTLSELEELEVIFKNKATCQESFFIYYENYRANSPHIEQIELTNACPYNCLMCPRPRNMTRPIGFMDLNLFQDICEQIAPYQKFLSLHHFGESLLHPQLPEAVSIAASFGLYTGLSCNAASMTNEFTSELQEAGLSSITFCLDSLHNQRYQYIRGTQRTVEENVAMIERFVHISELLKKPTLISLQMIQMRKNQDEGFSLLELAQSLNVDCARVIRFGQWDFSDEDAYQIADVSDRALYKPSCPVRWESVCILWNGTVVPCCRDYNGDIILGNLFKKKYVIFGILTYI